MSESTPQGVSVGSQPVAGAVHASGTTVPAVISMKPTVHNAAEQEGPPAGAASVVEKSLLADVSLDHSPFDVDQLKEGAASPILSTNQDTRESAQPTVRDIEPPAAAAAVQVFRLETPSNPAFGATTVVSKPAGLVEIDHEISPVARSSTSADVTKESAPVAPATSTSEAMMGSQEGACTHVISCFFFSLLAVTCHWLF